MHPIYRNAYKYMYNVHIVKSFEKVLNKNVGKKRFEPTTKFRVGQETRNTLFVLPDLNIKTRVSERKKQQQKQQIIFFYLLFYLHSTVNQTTESRYDSVASLTRKIFVHLSTIFTKITH